MKRHLKDNYLKNNNDKINVRSCIQVGGLVGERNEVGRPHSIHEWRRVQLVALVIEDINIGYDQIICCKAKHNLGVGLARGNDKVHSKNVEVCHLKKCCSDNLGQG